MYNFIHPWTLYLPFPNLGLRFNGSEFQAPDPEAVLNL
jgi:hypothetical protein